jgi:hypothetical protein
MNFHHYRSGLVFVLFMSIFVFSCSSGKPVATKQRDRGSFTTNNTDNDGSSFEKAIVIEERNSSKGIAAEYAWIKENYPGCTMKKQALVQHKNKPYDVLTIVRSDGREKEIHFDVSNFFGKF